MTKMNILFYFLISFSFSCFALSPITPDMDKFIKESQTKLASLQGGMLIIMQDQKIIHQEVFGHLSTKNKSPVDDHTLFSLASVSKALSALLVQNLIAANKIKWDSKLQTAFPKASPSIELQHLLSHTSGILGTLGNYQVESYASRKELERLFLDKNKNPQHVGQSYSYSNLAFSLMENILEKETQTSFAIAMKDFLKNIGAADAVACNVEQQSNLALPHLKSKKYGLQPILNLSPYSQRVCSAAGIYCSANDMVAIMKYTLSHYESFLPLFKPRVDAQDIFTKWKITWPYPIEEMQSSYGLGWRILTHKKNENSQLVFHSGFLNGVRTFLGFIPKNKLGIAILVNQESNVLESYGLEFWKRFSN